MDELQRPSPCNKPVSLFVTCIVDALYPRSGVAVVEVLEHLGLARALPAGADLLRPARLQFRLS